jgi:two-component system sensor kinase
MDAMIAGTITAVQRVTTELRPAVLEDLGLLPAMEWAISQIRRRTPLRIEFRPAIGAARLDDGAALALFRILQEALTNVVRHASASQVTVDLVAADGAVTLRVSDDGRGIRLEEAAGASALGILGMRERVLARGGGFAILPGEHGGTVLTATIPIECPSQPA